MYMYVAWLWATQPAAHFPASPPYFTRFHLLVTIFSRQLSLAAGSGTEEQGIGPVKNHSDPSSGLLISSPSCRRNEARSRFAAGRSADQLDQPSAPRNRYLALCPKMPPSRVPRRSYQRQFQFRGQDFGLRPWRVERYCFPHAQGLPRTDAFQRHYQKTPFS